MSKRSVANLLLLVVSLVFCLVAAEFAFRSLLFGKNPAFAALRQPYNFASPLSDDYWKLDYLLGTTKWPPPEDPHPLLGWTYALDRATLRHPEAPEGLGRRPVLLFGDSFAACVIEDCFQKILNGDPDFSRGHHLLNYGMGGYGLDQTCLLMREAVPLHDRPFVVFSLLTEDLDRSILTVRTGQKPWFKVSGATLSLQGVPMYPHPADFFKEHPPRISSYMWRRFLFSESNFLPASWTRWLKGEDELYERIRAVNALLLRDAVGFLRERGVDFMILVFETRGETDLQGDLWRGRFIREELRKLGVDALWSGDLVRADPAYRVAGQEPFYVANDGHPSKLQNELISAAIKARVLRPGAPGDGRPVP